MSTRAASRGRARPDADGAELPEARVLALEEGLAALAADVNGRFDALDGRFAALEATAATRFDAMMALLSLRSGSPLRSPPRGVSPPPPAPAPEAAATPPTTPAAPAPVAPPAVGAPADQGGYGSPTPLPPASPPRPSPPPSYVDAKTNEVLNRQPRAEDKGRLDGSAVSLQPEALLDMMLQTYVQPGLLAIARAGEEKRRINGIPYVLTDVAQLQFLSVHSEPNSAAAAIISQAQQSALQPNAQHRDRLRILSNLAQDGEAALVADWLPRSPPPHFPPLGPSLLRVMHDLTTLRDRNLRANVAISLVPGSGSQLGTSLAHDTPTRIQSWLQSFAQYRSLELGRGDSNASLDAIANALCHNLAGKPFLQTGAHLKRYLSGLMNGVTTSPHFAAPVMPVASLEKLFDGDTLLFGRVVCSFVDSMVSQNQTVLAQLASEEASTRPGLRSAILDKGRRVSANMAWGDAADDSPSDEDDGAQAFAVNAQRPGPLTRTLSCFACGGGHRFSDCHRMQDPVVRAAYEALRTAAARGSTDPAPAPPPPFRSPQLASAPTSAPPSSRAAAHVTELKAIIAAEAADAAAGAAAETVASYHVSACDDALGYALESQLMTSETMAEVNAKRAQSVRTGRARAPAPAKPPPSTSAPQSEEVEKRRGRQLPLSFPFRPAALAPARRGPEHDGSQPLDPTYLHHLVQSLAEKVDMVRAVLQDDIMNGLQVLAGESTSIASASAPAPVNALRVEIDEPFFVPSTQLGLFLRTPGGQSIDVGALQPKTMVDTGSGICLVTRRFVQQHTQLRAQTDLLEHGVKVSGVGNGRSVCRTGLLVTICLEGLPPFEQTVSVVDEQGSWDILIGMSSLRKLPGAGISYLGDNGTRYQLPFVDSAKLLKARPTSSATPCHG